MPDTIRDGKGAGNLAQVNSDNQLTVLSTTIDRLNFVSEQTQKSFSIYGKRNFAAADTNEGILYITYTGTKLRQFYCLDVQ